MHTCRIRDVSAFKETFYVEGEKATNGKLLNVLYGKASEGDQVIAFDYNAKNWTEAEAETHAKANNGIFEKAKNMNGSARMAFANTHWAIVEDKLDEVLSLMTDSVEAFFDVGEDAKTPLRVKDGVASI